MPSFRLRHPQRPGVVADYGYDGPSGRGFFVDVREGGALIDRYDATYATSASYDRQRPLDGALRFLATWGFYAADDLEEALGRLLHELPREMPRRLRRIALVVLNVKSAAD